jgi:hypothetical protein
MLTGCPRDNSIYPSTERWDERRVKVCSSSAGIGAVVAVADDVGARLGRDNKEVFGDAVVACMVVESTRCHEGGHDKPCLQMRGVRKRLNDVDKGLLF